MTCTTDRNSRNRRAILTAAIEPLERRMLLTAVVVNTIADSTDAPGSTVVSLRDAITVANKSTTATTITFSPTVFATAKTITLSGHDLEMSGAKPVTITGPAAGVTINGNMKSNEFHIDKGATLNLSGMTLTGGSSTEIGGNGGGIENDGAISLSHVIVSGNVATDTFGPGGGIDNNGTATLIDSTISGNNADYYGTGGGINNSGTITLTNCTVSGNASGPSNSGGGIASSGPITLTGCTISDNTGGVNGAGGGGIELSARGTLTNCTISNNTDLAGPGGGVELYLLPGVVVSFNDCTISGNTAGGGGGIDNYVLPNDPGPGNALGGICDIANTIVAGNTATIDPDTGGAFNSAGFNLIGNIGNSTGWKTADLTGTSSNPLNANLGPLSSHGGPTRTILPEVGSPAIDHGSNALIPKGITTDQRGYARIVNGKVDIGAVEVRDTSIITGTVFHDTNGSGLRDADEGGLGGFTVYLDLNKNGKEDPGEPSTTSNSAGQYTFTGLAPGNYTVRIHTPSASYYQTAPPMAMPTTVGSEQAVAGPVFGEVPIGPFSGKPAPFGLIQAENFDLGGQFNGYYNPTNINRGGLYRPAEGVGIGAIPSSQGGGYFVGYTVPGEYLNYTVSIAATASYTLEFRVSSQGQGGTFSLNVDGKNLTDELSVPNTGSYNVYTTVSEAGVTLTAGTHLVQLKIDSDVASVGTAGNFDWIQAVKTGPPNLLVNGNFAQGAKGFSSQYPNTGTAGGGYLIGPNPAAVFDGTWVDIGDHTTGKGLMLLADASTTANQYVWQETVNVTAATTYTFAGWAADMHKLDTNVPDLAIYVNNVQIGTTFAVPSNPGGIWSSFGATWKSGTSKTATIKIVDLDTQFAGNDFALDDLSFAV